MQAGDQATGLVARVSLGGAGRASVSTGLPVLDHLLGLLAGHAGFDLQLEVAPGGRMQRRTPLGVRWGSPSGTSCGRRA